MKTDDNKTMCPLRGYHPEKNPQPHDYIYSGRVPLTGAVLCRYCGHVCPCCDGHAPYHTQNRKEQSERARAAKKSSGDQGNRVRED